MLRRLVSLFCTSALLALAACYPPEIDAPQPHYKVSTTPPEVAPILPVQQKGVDVYQKIPGSVPVVKVGLLLPLSGESQALGQAMLDAAVLSLYDSYINLSPSNVAAKVILLPKDTGASPSYAATSVQQAIDQGASLIIGPLFSPAVTAAAPVARKAGVPILSLSNNKAVAGNGVFVYGFMPEQQVKRVSDYAALQNVSAFGALLPNDAYGAAVAGSLKAALTSKGVRVEPVEMYARTQANLEAAALRLREGQAKTPFQALFIADGGEQLKQVISALKTQSITQGSARFIGTGLWDDDEVKNNPDMKGAWFASGAPNAYQTFERRFTAAYGYKPQRLSSLTYDAVALATQLALLAGGPNYNAAVLTTPAGFVGPANGLYRLKADGTSERGLAVMEVGSGGVRILDQAPKQF